MTNLFNTVFLKKPKRAYFDLSHDRKFSMKMGHLYPILCKEVLPNDTFHCQNSQMIRFAPLVSPVMHNIKVYTHYFFVPCRLLWSNWEDFITGGDDGTKSPIAPYLNTDSLDIGSLGDYLGLPTGVPLEADNAPSALQISAFNLIVNEYYRDQNLEERLNYKLVDGDNTLNPNPLTLTYNSPPPPCNYRHDYFTSALPFAQKGPSVTIPMGESAELRLKDLNEVGNYVTPTMSDDGTPINGLFDVRTEGDATGSELRYYQPDVGNNPLNVDVTQTHEVDLSTAEANSINDLRRAFRLQEWLEKNARGGSRYVEHILNHFNRRSSDARLQRPEYLGGGASPVSIGEVTQMSASVEDGTPQGNMSGRAVNQGTSHAFKRNFEEHGFVIGIMFVQPEASYFQGIDRSFTRRDKFDYAYPTFAHIGEQEIYNRELYVGNDGEDGEVFGYTPRYAEYRFANSTVHGDFRETLEYWHLARKFANRPHLNVDFIKSNYEDFMRIFAVQNIPDDGGTGGSVRDWDTLYCHCYFSMGATRCLPKFGIPTT